MVRASFCLQQLRIKDEEQIGIIRSLGLQKLRYDPARNDLKALATEPAGARRAGQPADQAAIGAKEHPALAAKRALVERIKQQREASARIEHAFVDTARTIHSVEKDLLTHPQETVEQAHQLVGQIADSILSAPELAIHVMSDTVGGEEMCTFIRSTSRC